jgi:oxygen-independent coproporphyrinogen III oxidase
MNSELRDIPESRIFELVERLDTRGPRYTSYPTVPVWQGDFPAEPYVEALSQIGANGNPIAIYLHLPFCKSRCLYCGCNSYITCDAARMKHYTNALLMEIERVASHLPRDVRHGQLHLGGGTPTYTPAEDLKRVLDRVIELTPGVENAERSVEVDPRVTTDEYLMLLAERGFRRMSIGLQDLDPDVQRAVRREFTFEQMAEFVTRARSAGFTSVNIDLIYGLPLQTRGTWVRTLDSVVQLRPDRLACFGYAHLPQKIKHQQAIHTENLPSARERLGMLLDANRFFSANGYNAIGMDHFALPEDELAVARREGKLWRNFMGYTTSRGMELLGLGCSAISEFRSLFVQNITPPEAYADAIHAGKWAVNRGHLLDHEDLVRKQMINQLMCNLEISIPDTGLKNGIFGSLVMAMESLQPYVAEGLVVANSGGYAITPLGQLFLRNLAMPFDQYLDEQNTVTFSRTV